LYHLTRGDVIGERGLTAGRKQMDGDGNFDGLSAMGFSVLHNFEEVSCDAATWTMVPPL
jgi:hypothetical protein